MFPNEKEEFSFKLKTPSKNYIIRSKMSYSSFIEGVSHKLLNLNYYDFFFQQNPFNYAQTIMLSEDNFLVFLGQNVRVVIAICKLQAGEFNIRRLTFLYRKKFINQKFLRLLIQKEKEKRKEHAKIISRNVHLFYPITKLLLQNNKSNKNDLKVIRPKVVQSNKPSVEIQEQIDDNPNLFVPQNDTVISRGLTSLITNNNSFMNNKLESNIKNNNESFMSSSIDFSIGNKYMTSNDHYYQFNRELIPQSYKTYQKFPIETIDSKGKEEKNFYFAINLLKWKKDEIQKKINCRINAAINYSDSLIKIVNGNIKSFFSELKGKFLELTFKQLLSYKEDTYSSVLEIISKTTKEKLCQPFTIHLTITKSE